MVVYQQSCLCSQQEMGSSKSKGAKEPSRQIQPFAYKEMVKKSVMLDPNTQYKFLEKIGEGNHSQVFKAQSLFTGQFRVIKKVMRNSNPHTGRHFLTEFDILRQMDHPNIIKIYQTFEDETHHYIVMEYLPGKDALNLLVSLETINQGTAFNLVYQCLLALKYLHAKKVMHRDIKLENVIYDENTSCFKLIDFGSALKFASPAPQERRSTGTIHYIAPEVINRYYNMKCDVWSLGVLLYVLLSGNAPFTGQSHQEIIENILKHPLEFKKPIWETRSKQVKNFISKILQKNFEKRPSVSELLRDPWIMGFKQKKTLHKSEAQFLCLSLDRMVKFSRVKFTDIQIGILLFIIHFIIKIDNEAGLIRTFHLIDEKGDGEIDEGKLRDSLIRHLRYDQKTGQKFARRIMEQIDLNRSNDISFSQFVIAASDLRRVITHQHLTQAFRYIDTDGSQKISMKELQARLGHHLELNHYRELVSFFDEDNDGEVDFFEFSEMMTDILKQY